MLTKEIVFSRVKEYPGITLKELVNTFTTGRGDEIAIACTNTIIVMKLINGGELTAVQYTSNDGESIEMFLFHIDDSVLIMR